jgi:glutamine synthetase
VVSAFEKYGVLNERELRARYEVAVEQYNKSINIEANLMVLVANRYILPEAYRHQAELGETVSKVKAAGVTSKEAKTALERLCRLTDDCRQRVDKLQTLLEHQANGDAEKHARFRDKVIPAMNDLRASGDNLECIVPNDLWPLPVSRDAVHQVIMAEPPA